MRIWKLRAHRTVKLYLNSERVVRSRCCMHVFVDYNQWFFNGFATHDHHQSLAFNMDEVLLRANIVCHAMHRFIFHIEHTLEHRREQSVNSTAGAAAAPACGLFVLMCVHANAQHPRDITKGRFVDLLVTVGSRNSAVSCSAHQTQNHITANTYQRTSPENISFVCPPTHRSV